MEKKYCPVLIMVRPFPKEEVETQGVCLEARCAWWIDHVLGKGCAVSLFPRFMRLVTGLPLPDKARKDSQEPSG